MRIVDIDTMGESPTTIDVDDISCIFPLYGGESCIVAMKNGIQLQVRPIVADELAKLWKGEMTIREWTCSC